MPDDAWPPVPPVPPVSGFVDTDAPASPGWYPDGRGNTRWWNGISWSEGVAPTTATPGRQEQFGVLAAPPRRSRNLVAWIIGGLLALVIVVVVGSIVAAVLIPVFLNARSSPTDPPKGVVAAPAGTPGYFTFTGAHGKPMRVGAPWGQACMPIVLNPAEDLPKNVYEELVLVVDEARAAGINISAGTREQTWQPEELSPPGLTESDVAFVDVLTSTEPGPVKADGKPARHVVDWGSELDATGDYEHATSAADTLHLPTLGLEAVEYRRVFRTLVGFTQGISDSARPGSALKYLDPDAPDAFRGQDIAAMKVMSGCSG